jgi:hypothetical protein
MPEPKPFTSFEDEEEVSTGETKTDEEIKAEEEAAEAAAEAEKAEQERLDALSDEERQAEIEAAEAEKERRDALTDEERKAEDEEIKAEEERREALTDEEREAEDKAIEAEEKRWNALSKEEQDKEIADEKAETERRSKLTDEERKKEDEEAAKAEDEEFFDRLIKPEDKDDKGDTGEKTDFSSIAKDLDIELGDDEKIEDKDTFLEKVNAKIDSAKQEFDLSSYDEQTQKFIKYMNENGGNVADIFSNEKIAKFQTVIGMDGEEKVEMAVRQQLQQTGLSGEDLETKVEEKMKALSTREIKDAADDIDANMKKGINTELEEIVGKQEKDAEAVAAKATEAKAKEDAKFTSYLDKQETFLGLKMTDTLKASIKNDLKTGEIDKVVTSPDPEIRLNAYMLKKFGKSIQDRIQKEISENGRRASNATTKKHLSRLHQSKTTAARGSKGHEEKKKSDRKGWDLDEIE